MFRRFRTRHQPYMVRLSYRYELRSALTYPLAASLAEGSFTGVVAAKYFGGSPLLIAVISAAPMFGNIMALLWSELARTRPKVLFVNLLQLGVVGMIAAVAVTAYLPVQFAAWIFAFQIICVRVMASGIMTVRSAIWRFNYPRHIRGQIIGRISMVATAVLAAATFGGSWWLDRDPRAFVWLYPMAAVLGAIGIWQFSHIRVRHEGQMLRRQRQQLCTPGPEGISQTDETNVLNYLPMARGLRAFFSDALAVMRQDKAFRTYQRHQFISGFSFMMFGPSLLYMVSREMTDQSRQYLLATIVLQIIPMIVSLLFFQVWSPLFDRVHITVFRVYQGVISVAAQAMLFAGALWGWYFHNSPGLSASLGIVALAQVLVGIANAGGNLAWNLGHNDFAPPEKTATYMGVHVMLTGIRGCFAPFLGAYLYQCAYVGRGIFALSTLVCAVALAGFIKMARHAPAKVHGPQSAPERYRGTIGTIGTVSKGGG